MTRPRGWTTRWVSRQCALSVLAKCFGAGVQDVHLLRNALDSLPRKADDDCLEGAALASPTAKTRREHGGTWAAWIATWQGKDPKRADWVEPNIEETLTFDPLPAQAGLPRAHHQHRKSTNRLERLNEQIRRRTRVVRIFPKAESCPPWERGLPGRIEKRRQGWERQKGSRSPQRNCLGHDNLFAQIDRHNRDTQRRALPARYTNAPGGHTTRAGDPWTRSFLVRFYRAWATRASSAGASASSTRTLSSGQRTIR